jgi:predicted small lipoprotein YifL
MMRTIAAGSLIGASVLLAGCGQKGLLKLPTAVPPLATTPAAAPAAASAAASSP